jgi:hypothetical protein
VDDEGQRNPDERFWWGVFARVFGRSTDEMYVVTIVGVDDVLLSGKKVLD